MSRHLSASSITAWLDCPARFRATRVERRAEPVGAPLVVGIAMHTALEQWCRISQQGALGGPGSGFEPSEEELRGWFASAFRREGERVTTWGRGDRAHHERTGMAATVAMARSIAGLTPTGVEVAFSVPLREGWTIDGRIDLIADGTLFDFKSQTADTASQWRWDAHKARRQLQPGLYGLAAEVLGERPRQFVFVVADKTEPSGVERYQVPLSGVRLESARLIALVISHAVEREVFPRAAHGCAWCPFRDQGGC